MFSPSLLKKLGQVAQYKHLNTCIINLFIICVGEYTLYLQLLIFQLKAMPQNFLLINLN